jgi:ABC-2 type transport system ATP-binding protein
MTAAIELKHISKSFGDTNAVQELDLHIPQGSMCGFLGPNGAGKSTTIRMIMSIIHADSGSIEVLGTNALESKDRIGYLPEERGVYRKMKVCKFIEYIANLKGMYGSSLRKIIPEWLERIELADVENKKCEELSKGMQQKVQFLAAIIHEPELIILDEPFSGLDPVNARVIGNVINELHKEGRTILFQPMSFIKQNKYATALL